jgi:hypothetical protein
MWQRYWIRNILLTTGGLWLARFLYLRTVDGSIALALQVARETVVVRYKEHIHEPVSALVKELFDTIHREEIVSKRDLDQSKEALHRMLSDYSKSIKGIELFEKVKNTLNRISEQASTVVGGSVKEAMIEVPATSFSPEEALDALMKSYEAELSNPIQGVLFGNLATSILIQMQKLKVHTEAAMLKMDQVLASNQLTMAGTAAMPAFLLLGSIYVSVRWIFKPRSFSMAKANLRLRLALTEVERRLLELYCGKPTDNNPVGQQLEGLNLFSDPPSPFAAKSVGEKERSLTRDGLDEVNELQHRINSFSSDQAEVLPKFSESQSVDSHDGSHEELADRADMRYYHGMLHYSLIRLRLELYKFFSLPMADRTDNDATAIASYNKLMQAKRKYGARKATEKAETGFWSYVSLPWQLITAVVETWVWNREGADPSVSEYQGILKDIRDLESPDDDVNGSRKIITVMRMRNSYRCFIPKT